MSIDAGLFLAEVFPREVMSDVFVGIHRGYTNALRAIKDVDFLRNSLGKDQFGYLKNLAVQYELARLAKAGILPFRARLATNIARNSKHLELISEKDRAVITVAQVNAPRIIPRPAKFRQLLSTQNNQVTLFETFPALFASLDKEKSDIHILIIHGYKTSVPKFIHAGIPHADNKTWLDIIPILGVLPKHDEVEETSYGEFAMYLNQTALSEESRYGQEEQQVDG